MVSSNVDILKAGQIDLLSLKTRAEVLGGRGGARPAAHSVLTFWRRIFFFFKF